MTYNYANWTLVDVGVAKPVIPRRQPTLKQMPYPGCCGITIIRDFGHGNTQGSMHSVPIKDLEADLKDLVKSSYVGLQLISLNEKQVPYYEKIVKDQGFKLLKKFHHKGHGYDISLYGRETWPEKS